MATTIQLSNESMKKIKILAVQHDLKYGRTLDLILDHVFEHLSKDCEAALEKALSHAE
jgi:hypothetical protein